MFVCIVYAYEYMPFGILYLNDVAMHSFTVKCESFLAIAVLMLLTNKTIETNNIYK